MENLASLTTFHWLALGLLLFIAELLGASGFLVGAAIAALLLSIVVWLVPDLAVVWQISIYSLVSIAATVYYFKVFRKAQLKDEDAGLNNRAGTLIGHQFELSHDISASGGKVQLGDTMWKVESTTDLTSGTRVEVVGATQMSLEIAKI